MLCGFDVDIYPGQIIGYIGPTKFDPLFTVVFIVALFFAVLFVVFLANVFYLLLMKISTEDHFKDIILCFQIFMAAFAMGSYQLLPRLMEMDAFSGRIPRAQTILFNHLENDLLRP